MERSVDGWYILNGREVVPASSSEWTAWRRKNPEARIVKQEDVGDRYVSTVFLGLDHSFGDEGLRVFETMVFPSRDDMSEIWARRCATYDQADQQHDEACAWVLAGEPDER